MSILGRDTKTNALLYHKSNTFEVVFKVKYLYSIFRLYVLYKVDFQLNSLNIFCTDLNKFTFHTNIRVRAALLKIKSTTYKLFFAIFLTTVLL